MLAAEGLTLTVPGRVLCADLDLVLAPGEFWIVLGRNGSGKTTLLHALAGLTAPAAGRVTLDDTPLPAWAPRQRARALGLLPQGEAEGFWGTVRDYVRLGRHPYTAAFGAPDDEDEAAVTRALAAADLEGLADRALSGLSGGERQRARFAMLLAQEPGHLLLDEPLQHLDLAHQAAALERLAALARGGRAVMAVLHETAWATRHATHALLLEEGGAWRAGPAAEVLTLPALERLYGCPLVATTGGFVPG